MPKFPLDFYNEVTPNYREFRKAFPGFHKLPGEVMSEPEIIVTSPSVFRRHSGILAVLVGLVAGASFGFNLNAEPSFVDEWAYISQSYYAPLFFNGYRDHPAWLEYPAYDLPPLPKYLIGGALTLANYPLPGPAEAKRWYDNIKSEFGPPAMLIPARIPSVILGALGCVAIFGIGTLAFDHRTGLLAAILLMVNPLYRMHARRAMSDVVAESLIVLSFFFALWAWKQFLAGKGGLGRWTAALAAGVFGGAAALAKLNGGLAMIFVVLLALVALVLPRIEPRRKLWLLLASVLAGLASLATFFVGNPFLTAHPRQKLSPMASEIVAKAPWERAWYLITFRAGVSRGQQDIFPHNALRSPAEKMKTVAVQGYGRFGPFGPHQSDSTKRYDFAQDALSLIHI